MFYNHWNLAHNYGFGMGFGFGPLTGLVIGLLVLLPFWQLFARAGYSGWWSLAMLVPGVNLVALYVLAFSDWPAQHGTSDDRSGTRHTPAPPSKV